MCDEHDGSAPLDLVLDAEGSRLFYLPSFLPDPPSALTSLEEALSSSETSQAPPSEDHSDRSGRRQWFADLGMGWAGPRRWRRSCYRLRNDIGTEIDPILHLRSLIQAATPASAPELCETYNSVLVNRYSSGAAGIKWHADDERWYCVHERDNKCDIRIASVSLGAERFFEMRRRPQGNPDERRKLRIRLRSGSLLVMAGPCQEHWQHALPRDDECEGVRYNLTFRRVLTAEEDPTLRTVRAD